MKEKILKILVEKLWPWFQKIIWPFIEQKLVGAILSIIERLFTSFADRQDKKYNKHREDAKKNFYSASEDFKNAQTEEGRKYSEKWMIIWRNKAQEFADDVAEMDAHLQNLKDQLARDMEAAIKASEKDLKVDAAGDLNFGGQKIALPSISKRDLD